MTAPPFPAPSCPRQWGRKQVLGASNSLCRLPWAGRGRAVSCTTVDAPNQASNPLCWGWALMPADAALWPQRVMQIPKCPVLGPRSLCASWGSMRLRTEFQAFYSILAGLYKNTLFGKINSSCPQDLGFLELKSSPSWGPGPHWIPSRSCALAPQNGLDWSWSAADGGKGRASVLGWWRVTFCWVGRSQATAAPSIGGSEGVSRAQRV